VTQTARRRGAAPTAKKPAVALNGRVKLSWFEQGKGEPLVLIMGLGGSSQAWYRLLPLLDPGVRVIAFDHRGTGRSDGVRVRVTLDDMVADTLAVMDAAGVDDAHVFGVSMGGMVAQRLALEHRDRVRSLVLGCTTARAVAGLPPWRMIAALWMRQLAPRQSIELVVPMLYAERTRREAPDRIRADVRVRAREATSPLTIFAQMAAIGSHDTRSRLRELDGLDVTVIHGSEDALVRVGRGRELAARIPGARLREIDECGHLLLTDAEDAVMAAIDEHLRRAGALSAAAA
jgi:pimeloyl-ACP methyl ester carboxylesterase